MGTYHIELQGMEFFAYHGVYEEERKMGNKYEVDIRIIVQQPSVQTPISLDQTIDYEEVYCILKQEIFKSTKLLETIARQVSAHLLERYPQALGVEVKVSKHNPPVGGICRKASVTWVEENGG